MAGTGKGVAQAGTLSRNREIACQVTLLTERLGSKKLPVAHEDFPSKG